MPGEKGKFIIYSRVSGAPQEEGTSLDTQEAACMELALSQGYLKEDAIILREVWTGVTLDRPQLTVARQLAADGEVTGIRAFSTDRLSRDGLELLMVVREFVGLGVDVQFVQEPTDSSPEGELVFFVRGFAWRQEHAKIRERTVRARDAMARNGVWPGGWKNPPYGYVGDSVNRKRVVVEEEAKVVRWIFRKYADGWSFYRIAVKLNDDGIPSKTGGKWSPVTIKGVLQNSTYIGVDYYGKKRSVGGDRGKAKQVRVPKEQWIELRGYSPRIVSDSVWLRVQERFGEAQARRTGSKYQYVLTGFVKCGRCGVRSVTGSGLVAGVGYYWCSGAARWHLKESRPCKAGRINGRWLQAQVWAAVVSMVEDPSGVIAALKLGVETGGGDLGKEIKRIQAELARVESEEKRLLVLYTRDTKVRVELLDAQAAQLSASREDLQNRLASLEKQRASVETVEEASEQIREYCQRVRHGLDDLDVDGQRALMYRLGIKVVAVPGDLLVTAELDSGFVVNIDTSPPGSSASPG